MTEITTTRCPWARIALAGLNTGHPGPMPRGTMGSGRYFAGYKGQYAKICCFVGNWQRAMEPTLLDGIWQVERLDIARNRCWPSLAGYSLPLT